MRMSFAGLAMAGLLAVGASNVLAQDGPTLRAGDLSKVADDLIGAMRDAGPDEYLPVTIVMTEQASRDDVQTIAGFARRSEQRQAMMDLLMPIAERTQADLLAYLDDQQVQGRVDGNIRSLWIHNLVGAEMTREVVLAVAQRDDVANVYLDHRIGKEVFPYFQENGGASTEIECGVGVMRAPEVWDTGNRGEGIVVGVIDTGCCITHPDLANQVWVNSGEIPGNNIDDDNNGYVDDINGWNFEGNNNNIGDSNGHGTHVTGTVVGNGANGTETGMAPNAQFMTLKFWNSFSGEQTVWDGMQYGVANGADVLTASLGWPHSFNPVRPVWRAICENSMAAGVIVVYAAGNEGSCCGIDSTRTPGDVPLMITVGATDCNDNLASFSSHGPVSWTGIAPYNDWPHPPGKMKPTISAPGVNTKSTSNNCSGYTSLSGTSMATPHVAGAIALMLSENPELTHWQVKQLLQNTSVDLGAPGRDNQFGAGRVDAFEAVMAAANANGEIYCHVEPLFAGQNGEVIASNCTPNRTAYFIASLRGTGSTYVPALNVTLDLSSPVLVGSDSADGDGFAGISRPLNNNLQGREVWIQVAQTERKSNVVTLEVQ